jgi:5-methylcytosine-specific restriction endonuclease McrA
MASKRLYGRPNARDRGYDRRWEAASARYRDRHPFCVGCEAIGVTRWAEVVDHIVPHRGNERLFWEPTNWQSLCRWHHDAIKPILEHAHRAGKIPSSELLLSSATAVELTRARHRPAVGVNGYPIPGT